MTAHLPQVGKQPQRNRAESSPQMILHTTIWRGRESQGHDSACVCFVNSVLYIAPNHTTVALKVLYIVR